MTAKNGYLQRWLTGVVLAAAILLIILFGSVEVLASVITIVSVVATWEYNNIVFGKGFFKEKFESLFFAFLIPPIVLLGNFQIINAALVFSFIIVFIVFLWRVTEDNFDVASVAKVIFGIIYIPFLVSHFILLRQLDNGIYWIFLVLVIAIVGDTVALYVGKTLGKRKLLALVSPGKTVEGTLGLIVGSSIAACVFGYFLFPDLSIHHFLILGFTGGIIGQLGDLCESSIKRNYGLKDASALLPGHGGLLDRLDSLIFIAPYIYYYKIFVVGT
ncbi:MAG: phosphatidate cytidylyltransferase [Smithellaceae bacterium]